MKPAVYPYVLTKLSPSFKKVILAAAGCKEEIYNFGKEQMAEIAYHQAKTQKEII
jgi:hypothetical protein